MFSHRGTLDNLNSSDKHEIDLTPGHKYSWTAKATDGSEGKLHVHGVAPEPTESAMWEGGYTLIGETVISAGNTASGSFVVPQVHNRHGNVVATTRCGFKFSRLITDRHVGYTFSATRVA